MRHHLSAFRRFPPAALPTLIAVALALGASAGGASSSDPVVDDDTPDRWAIRGVDVVPMDRPAVLRDRTVVVAGDTIERIGPSAEVPLPDGIETVDGRGRWLLPGLVDTHVHLDDPDDLLLYLVNGVTTVANLRGSPRHLAWRRELAAGERLGPRMLTCGPFLRGHRLELEEIAPRVREIDAAGYDCIKIYDEWGLEQYRRVAAASREVGIPFLGHAPREIGLAPVLADGRQRIVHLEELVYATPALDAWVEGRAPGSADAAADPEAALGAEVRELAGSLARAGIRVAATEVVIDTYLARSTPAGLERLAARPERRFLDPFRRRRWAAGGEPDHARFVRQVRLQHLLLRALREAGVPVALGTDASTTSDLQVMPGWSLHEELEILVEAGGFTPYEALRQATVDAFAFLDRPGGGRIAEGAPADLLLLRANPLEDVRNAQEIETVVVGGTRHRTSDLERLLEERREAWQPLERALAEADATRRSDGPTAATADYLAIAERHPAHADQVEALVNSLGYELLGAGRTDEAVAVLRANAETFPDSANTWDSLAEAHLEAGDREEAIRLYRRALEVDPEFGNSRRMLRELGVEEAAGPAARESLKGAPPPR